MDHLLPQPQRHPTERLVGTCPAIAALRAQLRHLAAFDTLGNPAVPTVCRKENPRLPVILW